MGDTPNEGVFNTSNYALILSPDELKEYYGDHQFATTVTGHHPPPVTLQPGCHTHSSQEINNHIVMQCDKLVINCNKLECQFLEACFNKIEDRLNKMDMRMDKIEEVLENLQTMIEYAPGGALYQSAKERFERLDY